MLGLASIFNEVLSQYLDRSLETEFVSSKVALNLSLAHMIPAKAKNLYRIHM